MNKAAWIRLSVWIFILVLTIFASWFFYHIQNINHDYDFYEYLFELTSLREITQELNEYDALKFLAEFEDFKNRLSPDGEIDRMVQGLRDYRDSIGTKEYFETPKDFRDDLKVLYAFRQAVYEHVQITDAQIIGWEDLSLGEQLWIKENEMFQQWRTLNWTMQPIYKGDIENLFWVFRIEREIIGYTERDLSDYPDEHIAILPDEMLQEPVYAENDYFDVLKNINFTEFVQTAKDYDPIKGEYNYYFTIKTEGGRGLTIGDMSASEWVVRSQVHYRLPYNTFFMPVDWERIDFIPPPAFTGSNGMSDFVNISVLFSTYSDVANFLLSAHIGLIYAMRIAYDDLKGDEIRIDADEFIRRAEYTLGIYGLEKENLAKAAILQGDEVYAHQHFLEYPRILVASLVSEDITDDSAVVVLDFYRRNCYYELAKTVRYEFELGTHGWQLISVETLFETDGGALAYRQ